MKHEHVFTQTNQSPTPEGSRTISKLFSQDRNIKFGFKALCTLLCTIALILECINVTLNKRCNRQNNQITVSLLETIPKVLPVHSETDIPNDLCAERRKFPLEASNKRVNVCTYLDRIRVDVREFINDRATIKGPHFTLREFVSFNGALPFVRHEILRQIEILRIASNSTEIVDNESCHHLLSSCLALCTNIFLQLNYVLKRKKLNKLQKMIDACCDANFT